MSVRRVQLGEVCDFFYGDSLKEELRRSGKIPVFGSNGIVGWHDQATTSGPTIVIGRKGSIGEINWSSEPCFPIDTTYFVEKTKKPCDLRWLYFTLLKLDLTRFNKSAAVPGLNREDAYEQIIPFPDLPEQQRIAGLLEQADRLRRTRRYALELSATFLPAAFLQLFGDPAKNPKDPLVPLGELIVSGPQNGLYKPASSYGSGTRIVRIDAYQNGSAIYFAELQRVRLSPEEITTYGLIEDDFLINRVNSRTHLGKSTVVPRLSEPAVYESNMMRFRVDANRLSPVYAAQFLQSPFMNAQIQKRAKDASNQSSINQEDVEGFLILLPPLARQHHFAALVAQHERLRANQREALRQAEHEES